MSKRNIWVLNTLTLAVLPFVKIKWAVPWRLLLFQLNLGYGRLPSLHTRVDNQRKFDQHCAALWNRAYRPGFVRIREETSNLIVEKQLVWFFDASRLAVLFVPPELSISEWLVSMRGTNLPLPGVLWWPVHPLNCQYWFPYQTEAHFDILVTQALNTLKTPRSATPPKLCWGRKIRRPDDPGEIYHWGLKWN